MKPLPALRYLCWGCTCCLARLLLWASWLALTLLLIFQLRIVSSHELPVPSLLLRSLERRLATQGLILHFGDTHLDKHGNILLRDFSLSTSALHEPLFQAAVVEFRIDPSTLFTDRVIPRQLRITGGRLNLPSMLSPSGANEPVFADLNLTLSRLDDQLEISHLTTRLANLSVSLHGTLNLPAKPPRARPDASIDSYTRTWLTFLRRIADQSAALNVLDHPSVNIQLISSESAPAQAHLDFVADGALLPPLLLHLPPETASVSIGQIRAASNIPLTTSEQNRPLHLDLSLASLTGPYALAATRLTASIEASLAPDWKINLHQIEFTTPSLTTNQASPRFLSSRATFTDYEHITLESLGALFGDHWTVTTQIDLTQRALKLTAASRITPELLRFVGEKSGRDIPALIQPAQPAPFAIQASLSAKDKLISAQGWFTSGPVTVRTVPIDSARAEFVLTKNNITFERARLVLGASEARGSYSMDTHTFDYRFLLTGCLHPSAINGWFTQWWPRFWETFSFPGTLPQADIDIQGRWPQPGLFNLFTHVEAPTASIRQVPFDHVSTTLFVRPEYLEALSFTATHGPHKAHGRFSRSYDLPKNLMRWTRFDLTSDLELSAGARLFGQIGADIVQPFKFSAPPNLTLKGQINGATPTAPAYTSADIQIKSRGPMEFFQFPLADLNCRATVRGDEIDVSDISVQFARGIATGHARISGLRDQRRLGFDGAIENASFGEAIHTLELFAANRAGQPPPPFSNFQQSVTTGRLDLRLSGDGNYNDLYSFTGNGYAEVTGAELRKINLLGALSKVLNFTSLQLNSAQGNFKLDHQYLRFRELLITGPTARVNLDGHYRLDLKTVDFNAKVRPFAQSENAVASTFNLILSPLSSILELRLDGKLDQPNWHFSYGPGQLLRNISGQEDRTNLPPPSLLTPLPR